MTLIKTLFFGLFLFAFGCSNMKLSDQARPRVHNHATQFLTFWEKYSSQPNAAQLLGFKTEFAPLFPEFYRYKIEKWKKIGKSPDQELSRELSAFTSIKIEFEKKTLEVSKSLEANLTKFVSYFPKFDRNFDVHITHSLGDMDGGTREIEGKVYFILGVDGMVRYHQGFSTESPFFHHELFHVYHNQYLPEDKVIWVALWAEGLATYASEILNPGSSLKDLMLDLPANMVREINDDLLNHWVDLESKLESRKDEDYESYFLLSSTNQKVIKRAGYYLGYLLAKEIGKTKSLAEMAEMKPKDILLLLKTHLKKQVSSIRP